MSKINRRTSLKFLGVGGLGAGLVISGCDTKPSQDTAGHTGGDHQHQSQYSGISEADQQLLKQQFFTDQERKTVRILADLIIPADDRSGSASDAGVPEFIEFMMLDQPGRQTGMRGGLAWLNNRCLKLYEKDFTEIDEQQRIAVLDEIAYPKSAKPEVSQGVTFFNNFRDLTATGFWTSKMGIDDLQYLGNVGVASWEGCPDEACQRLGVSYDDMQVSPASNTTG
jgi:gluconate 2-dehydrogenase gamma chain